jgi:membrane-bound serine protease (ClpP class)
MFAANSIDSIEASNNVYKLSIKEEIGPGIWRQTKQAFEEAEKKNATHLLIHMNTYGGTALHADSIRTLILNSDIPVIVFIDNNAASAGALIAIACDRIFMRSGANIGAATVVNQNGEVMPDKYQSYMRSMMRSTAEAKGRNPQIAQAMVDPAIYVKDISDTGKVLTFTTQEAIRHNFCDGKAESVTELLSISNLSNSSIITYQPSNLEKAIGLLVNPMISGLLLMLIIGGIYFELQTPGIGFPIAASIIASILYFAPLYLEGLANNYEIALFISGLILISLEVFVIPGFGIAGITGLLLSFSGLTLSLIYNIGFDFSLIHFDKVISAVIIVSSAFFLSIILSFYFGVKMLKSNTFSKLILDDTQDKSEGYVSININKLNLIGKKGISKTILRPSGKIELDSQIYDATAETGYIEKDTKVIVVKFETSQLFVRSLTK